MSKNRFLIAIFSICVLVLAGCSKNTKSSNSAPPLEIQVIHDTGSFWEGEGVIDTEQILDSIDPGFQNSDETYSTGTRILCYGDSLTESYGGDGVTMPDTIAQLSGMEVLNYGVFGDSLSAIAARQGSNPQYLCEDIVIPADTTPVKAQVEGQYGYEMLVNFGDAGVNTCILGGIEGTYAFDDDGNRCFTRLEPGEETPLPKGTQIYFHAMIDKRPNDILVLWGGSNDEPQSVDEIPAMLEKIDKIIEFHGNDQYVIVSVTSRHTRIPVVDEVNKAYAERYGEHYVDIRTFLVNESLDYLGITPTEHDREAIAAGDVPYSIRLSDDPEENHGNADFYRLAGTKIYEKLVELGYIN